MKIVVSAWVFLLTLVLGVVLLGFSTRVESYHIPSFTLGAAAGWLNPGGDRSFDLKGTYTVNKFGFNADVDTTEESIWDADDLPTAGAGPGRCFANMASAAALYVSSDDATDAAVEIVIEVLDANYVVSTVTMDLGAAAATTGTVYTQIGTATLLRVNRAYATDTSFTGNIYIHTDTVDTGTDGVPDIPSTQIVAVITAGENQTLQACYTVPAGYTAMLLNWCKTNASQAAASTAVTFRWRKTLTGMSSRTQSLISLGDEVTQCTEVLPPGYFPEKTDIEVTGGGATSQAASADFGLLLLKN